MKKKQMTKKWKLPNPNSINNSIFIKYNFFEFGFKSFSRYQNFDTCQPWSNKACEDSARTSFNLDEWSITHLLIWQFTFWLVWFISLLLIFATLSCSHMQKIKTYKNSLFSLVPQCFLNTSLSTIKLKNLSWF